MFLKVQQLSKIYENVGIILEIAQTREDHVKLSISQKSLQPNQDSALELFQISAQSI